MVLSNLHTHTVFCDGMDTPEELVLEALRLGCRSIGFSGHAHMPLGEDWYMSPEQTEDYKSSVLFLQEKYRGQINIYLGVEQDIYSDAPTDGYDYVIGSVHYVQRDGCMLPVDESRESLLTVVREHYHGDFYALAEDYYTAVARVYELTRCHIVGHFDLITKYNEANALFDTGSPRYRRAANRALDTLLDCPVAFELNTGAMARGYRTTPYPEESLVRRIRAAGKPLLLTSDCHDRTQLLYKFSDYEAWLR